MRAAIAAAFAWAAVAGAAEATDPRVFDAVGAFVAALVAPAGAAAFRRVGFEN